MLACRLLWRGRSYLRRFLRWFNWKALKMIKKYLDAVVEGISRKKPLLDNYSNDGKLKKCLSTFDLIAIGVSCTLGSGVYVLTGAVAKSITGPAIVLSFLIAAIASMLSGVCYAEFATRIPKSGSAYIYTYISVGEFAAFFVGWNLMLEYIIGSAVVARAFSAYVDQLTGGVIFNATHNALGGISLTGFSRHIDFLSLGITLFLTLILLTGVKNSSIFNNLLTVINILVALFVVIVGAFHTNPDNWKPFAPFGVEGIIAGASTCFFSFIGFDVIATTAEEANNPSRSIPRSIIGTICICFLVYFLMSTVVTLMVPYQRLSVETAVSDAFSQVNIKWANYCVSVGAGASMLGCTLVSLFPLPRLLHAMSEDGMIPLFFSSVSSKTQSPYISTIVGGIFTGLVAMVFDLAELVEMLSIGTLLAYTMVDLCVIKLRYEVYITHYMEVPMQKRQSLNEELHIQEKEESNITQTEKIDKKQNIMVARCLFFIVINLILLASFSIFHRKINITLVTVVIVICLLGSTIATVYVYNLPQSDKELVFKAPFVPFLPVLAVFVNIYLMMELRRLTWIRLIVWMTIGIVVYFSYSLKHSTAVDRKGSKDGTNANETEPLLSTG